MSLPKILFADGISNEGRVLLEPHDGKLFNVEICEGISTRELLSKIPDVSCLIVRTRTAVDENLLKNAAKLKVIGRIGIGVDHIDVAAAHKKNIAVMTVGDANATSVAELTVGMAISFSRRLPAAYTSMKWNQWEPKELQGFELSRKTFGIIGLGRIGSRVARRMQAMDMRVIACDPYIESHFSDRLGVRLFPLDEVLAQSHLLSLHIPLTSETKKLLNERSLQKMKKGSYLVNTARGEVVDESSIVTALNSGDLAGYAADVFQEEPLSENHPLRTHPKAFLTPHFGAQTFEAQKRANEMIAKQIIHYFRTGEIQNRID